MSHDIKFTDANGIEVGRVSLSDEEAEALAYGLAISMFEKLGLEKAAVNLITPSRRFSAVLVPSDQQDKSRYMENQR